MSDKTYEVAPIAKRVGALIIDFAIIFLLWYLFTIKDMENVDKLMQTLDPSVAGSQDIFAQAIIKMVVIFVFKFIFAQTLYFCICPAIIGRGKTIGKLVFRLSMVLQDTLKEVSPSRLFLREFVLRSMLETLLIVPMIVSIILVCCNKSSLHDRLAKTLVVGDSSYLDDNE